MQQLEKPRSKHMMLLDEVSNIEDQSISIEIGKFRTHSTSRYVEISVEEDSNSNVSINISEPYHHKNDDVHFHGVTLKVTPETGTDYAQLMLTVQEKNRYDSVFRSYARIYYYDPRTREWSIAYET